MRPTGLASQAWSVRSPQRSGVLAYLYSAAGRFILQVRQLRFERLDLGPCDAAEERAVVAAVVVTGWIAVRFAAS